MCSLTVKLYQRYLHLMRWLHLSVIAIKTFMSSSNTFPSAPGCIALGMKPYSSQRSTNNCISKAWWSMLAPQVKYQLPGKFGVNPRPPVIVQLWLIGWFKLITLPRRGILKKLGMVVLGVGTHTPAKHWQSLDVLRGFNRLHMCDRQSQRNVLLLETDEPLVCVC